MFKIPVYKPYLNGKEKEFVNECLDSTWISSKGPFIHRFEQAFSSRIGSSFALAVSNGTTALHLALLGLNIGPGDEVIVPSLTYIASVNAIAYTGATPVFADSSKSNWQIDPVDVLKKFTPKTKAILAVHLYGHPCDVETLRTIAHEKGIYLIEDCAEAFGSFLNGVHVGNFGHVSTFSFFGNKTITTGEGGMVTTNDALIHKKISILKNQGNDPEKPYWHNVIGYNYRMTNIAAAIGLAQLEQADEILRKKRELAQLYSDLLRNVPVEIHLEEPNCIHSYWMISILVNNPDDRNSLRDFLLLYGIETRPFFHPIHLLPMYQNIPSGLSCKNAENISGRGINLPSFPDLSRDEVEYVCKTIEKFFQKNSLLSLGAAGTQEALRI